jgi:hypothetical protein
MEPAPNDMERSLLQKAVRRGNVELTDKVVQYLISVDKNYCIEYFLPDHDEVLQSYETSLFLILYFKIHITPLKNSNYRKSSLVLFLRNMVFTANYIC